MNPRCFILPDEPGRQREYMRHIEDPCMEIGVHDSTRDCIEAMASPEINHPPERLKSREHKDLPRDSLQSPAKGILGHGRKAECREEYFCRI